MFAAHTVPRTGTEELLVDGRPSVLFALVAGVALGLVTGGPTPTRPEGRAEARVRLALRALVLFVMGVLLWMLPHGVAVILDYYGAMFLLMVPLVLASRLVLAGVGAVVLVVGPLVRQAIEARPLPGEPLDTAIDYLLTGWYPALLWVPVLAAGLIAARSDLGLARTRIALVGFGTIAAVAGYGAAAVLPEVDAAAHSGTTAELLGAGGLAAAVVGLLLVLLDPQSVAVGAVAPDVAERVDAADRAAPARRVLRILLAPVTAIGRMPLTIYVAHLLVLAAISPLGPAGRFDGVVGWVVLVVLAVASASFALAWQALRLPGPLEWVLQRAAGLPFRYRSVRDLRA
ncbi:DUF418 domain-containing protein [Microcella flavibacter]|uniref:DUF418 domain-containing protein n=1 Tax=Microcella flavibacter TaxID=1804990 RepID=UPI001E5FA653|nr:DUF418 domain-containing protein [Microcella flavibacter]